MWEFAVGVWNAITLKDLVVGVVVGLLVWFIATFGKWFIKTTHRIGMEWYSLNRSSRKRKFIRNIRMAVKYPEVLEMQRELKSLMTYVSLLSSITLTSISHSGTVMSALTSGSVFIVVIVSFLNIRTLQRGIIGALSIKSRLSIMRKIKQKYRQREREENRS